MSAFVAGDDIEKVIAALEAHLSEPEFNDDDYAHAEKTLRRAYRTTVQGAASTSEFFAGMYKTENKQFRDSKLPEYFMDPEYPDERRDRWATQVHIKETPPAKFSREPIDQQCYLYASVHAVVNALPERYLVFIKAQYMPSGHERGHFLQRFFDTFWRDYQPQIPAGANRIPLFVFAQTVVGTGGGKEKFLEAMLREKIGGKRANWYRNYLPHWRAMKDRFEETRIASLTAFLLQS